MSTPNTAATTTFVELHQAPGPLLLPNAWDVVSALAFAGAGYAAVGTTSFGVAACLGRPDGERASRDGNLALARALHAMSVPLSVDIEDGYADDPEQVATYVAALADAGVAGINIEDSTGEALIDPEVHAAKVTAIKRRSPAIFLNARVDNYWLGEDAHGDSALTRAERYVRAGADGIFLPGLTDRDVLTEACRNLPVPVNALISPHLGLSELAGLGVRRISTGSLPYRASLQAALDVASAVREGTALPAGIPYADLQDTLRS